MPRTSAACGASAGGTKPSTCRESTSTSRACPPTRGRRLDHIGFEIEGLDAFCKALEAQGVEFDRPYSTLPSGFGLAFLTDPWGTYIELTEGLRDL